MKLKPVKLILTVSRLSKKMESMSKDLDKIAELLQDPEILSVLGEKNVGVLTFEDFD